MLEHAAAVEVLRGALVPVDPSEPFRVSWFRQGQFGGWYASRRNPRDEGDADDPHTVVTLSGLAGDIADMRRVVTSKGSGDALCGGAWRLADDGAFWRRAEHCAGASLLQLDVDAEGEALLRGPTLADAVARAAALGLSVIAHPSPSSTAPARDARRFRMWVRVAVEGAAELHFTAATDRGDVAHAFRAAGAVLRAALLHDAPVDESTWHPGALGYTNAATAEAVGGVRTTNGFAANPWALRDAAIAAGLWLPFVRGADYVTNGAELLELVRAVDALIPGTIGLTMGGGKVCIRCPDVDLHTAKGGKTPGDGRDLSCAMHPVAGFMRCLHNHGGRGGMGAFEMVKRWQELLPAAALQLRTLWSRTRSTPDVDIAAETFVGAPGDTSDPRVAWDVAADGSAVHSVANTAAAVQDIVDDMRATARRWEAGERAVRLRVDPTGTGKSTTAALALAAIAPELPGETDDRPDTPRPLAVYVVETVRAAREAQDRIDAAGRGDLDAARRGDIDGPDIVTTHNGAPLRRGRRGSVLRAARHLPVSAVGADGCDIRGREGAKPACLLHSVAEHLEARGLDARSLCTSAGTSDPRTLRHAAGRGRPCPESSAAGGRCPAEHPDHYADGTVPETGDAFALVVTGDAVAAAPGVVRGGVHIIDETGRATSPAALSIEPVDVAVGSPAERLSRFLRGDAQTARQPTRAAAAAFYAGALAMLRERGPDAVLRLEGAELGAELRAERFAAALWARVEAPHQGAPQWTRDAARTWPRLTMVRDPSTCPHAPALAALAAFLRARPAVGRWKGMHWRDGVPDVSGQVWRALAAYFTGGTVEAHTVRDATENAPHAMARTGGAVVHAFPSPLPMVPAMIERGPVFCLDATADATMIRAAVRAGDVSTVEGVRARAIDVPDAATVRRLVVRTPAATKRGMLRFVAGHGDVVRWRNPNGAAAGTILRAVVALLVRDAPRDEGGRLAPLVFCAPRTLTLTVRALYDGAPVEALRAGAHPAVCNDHGKPYAAAVLAAVAASVEAAANEPDVLGAVEALRGACSAVWWTWPGGTLARGSNAPHEGGARIVVTIGDGLIRPDASALRARLAGRHGDEGVRAQQRRDAAAALAQVHGRVRTRRTTGPVLLVHFGTARPWDWTAPEVVTLDALRSTLARRAAPAADVDHQQPPTEPEAPAPAIAAPLVRAAAGGWSQAAVARMAGVTERAARKWYAGETEPGAEHLGALSRALDAADNETRAGYRALMLAGRRHTELLRGKSGTLPTRRGMVTIRSEGIIEMSADPARKAPGARALDPAELPPATFAAWLEGRAELPPDVVATLNALRAPMTAEWGRKPPDYFDAAAWLQRAMPAATSAADIAARPSRPSARTRVSGDE